MTDILKYDVLPAGARVGAFEIQQALGVSRYGITYRAWDTHRESPAAIREYLPSDYAKREKGGTGVIAEEPYTEVFEDGLSKFLQEARSLSQIHDPHVARVTEYTEGNGTAYLVMEFEAGRSLKDYLARKNKKLPEEDLKALLLPMLKALRVVHGVEVLHRDISPAHLFLRETGPAVLLGFGNVRPHADGLDRTASPITPGYSAIEQYQDHGRLGPWTDIYALGASMYRCIAGADPVEATARIAAIAEEREDPLVPALEIGRGDYSTSLLGTLDWMLQPAATDRPDCAGAVLGLLAEDVSHAPTQVTASAAPTPASPPTSGRGTAPRRPTAAQRPARPAPQLSVPPAPAKMRAARRLPWFTRPGFVLGSVILVAALVVGVNWLNTSSPAKTSAADAVQRDGGTTSPTPEPDVPPVNLAELDAPPDMPESLQLARAEDEVRAASYRDLDRQRETVSQRLASGHANLAAGNLIAPSDNNALSDFRAVLDLDPSNQDARQGINQIVTRLLENAEQAMAGGDLKNAETWLNRVVAIEPDNINANALAEQISDHKARVEAERLLAERRAQEEALQHEQETERRQNINRLLDKAEDALSANRLIEPPGSNALGFYREVLQLDPQNERAVGGIRQIAGNYINQANRAMMRNELGKAEGYLAAAATIDPDDASLRLLREQLDERRKLLEQERLVAQRAEAVEQQGGVERVESERRYRAEQETQRRIEADLKAGINAYYGGSYYDAYRLLKPLAEEGNARAQFRIGMMYSLGRGAPKNPSQAEDWIRKALPAIQKAAAAGEPWAQADLGSLYEDGLVVTKSEAEAARWYQRAAEQGYAGAQTNLGVMYANGTGVRRDRQEAVKWLRKAAAQGDRVAKENLDILGIQ